jgi:hypothetical protein
MRTDSNRELARRLGTSETAVRRAEKAGRIRREPDGSWDPATVKAAWSDNTDQAQQRGEPGTRQPRRPARSIVKPVPEAALGAVRDTLREHGEPIPAGPGQTMTFMQARTASRITGRFKGGAMNPRDTESLMQRFRIASISVMRAA